MPSDSKKKREQKKKDAAKKRDVKKPTSACDAAASDGDAASKLTDGDTAETVNGDQPESCNGANEGELYGVSIVCFNFMSE